MRQEEAHKTAVRAGTMEKAADINALSTPILAPVRGQGCGNEGQRKEKPEQMATEEYGNSEGQSQAGKPTRGPGASQPPGSSWDGAVLRGRDCQGGRRS